MQLADRAWFRPVWPAAVTLVAIGAGYILSMALSSYLVFIAMSATVASISILGLGVVTGSAGMIALCQLTFAATGAWIVAGLNVMAVPGGFIVWLVIGGLGAGFIGMLVGLPALRLRGINLAVVTLGFAAAADVTLVLIQFPGSAEGIAVERPEMFQSDREFLFFCIIVLAVVSLAVHLIQRSRWGAAWQSVAFSERGTAAAGQSVRAAKLTAFAVSAAVGGISGGLLAGQVQLLFASSFTPLLSLALYVLATMSGAHLIDMAIFGGILWVVVPELLKRWGIPQDWAFVAFGAAGMQALTSGKNLGEVIREIWWKRHQRQMSQPAQTTHVKSPSKRRSMTSDATGIGGPRGDAPVLSVEKLTVEFGALKALNDVTFEVPSGSIMGLIGPNGAGKSTFVDVVTGFLPGHGGRVLLDGQDLVGMSPAHRARRGLRRTFQQDRVPPSLTIEQYVRFVAGRRLERADIDNALAFFGCPPARSRLVRIDVGARRLIEVVANILARPRLVILDEPAAGLSHAEHVALAERLREVPDRYGVSLIVIEHDLDLLRSLCPRLTVLDFGRMIASGPLTEVLEGPAVIKAYMGDTETLL